MKKFGRGNTNLQGTEFYRYEMLMYRFFTDSIVLLCYTVLNELSQEKWLLFQVFFIVFCVSKCFFMNLVLKIGTQRAFNLVFKTIASISLSRVFKKIIAV